MHPFLAHAGGGTLGIRRALFESAGGFDESLLALHLPMALWLAVGVAYAGGRWSQSSARMDFIRFSGELFIYFVLIALGGGVMSFMGVLFVLLAESMFKLFCPDPSLQPVVDAGVPALRLIACAMPALCSNSWHCWATSQSDWFPNIV